MCSSVIHVCRKYGVQIRFYHVGIDFRPQRMELGDSEWLYLMNFYGQISREELEEAGKKYKRVIVDFAHDYFQEPIAGLDTIYTCRKFLVFQTEPYFIQTQIRSLDWRQMNLMKESIICVGGLSVRLRSFMKRHPQTMNFLTGSLSGKCPDLP